MNTQTQGSEVIELPNLLSSCYNLAQQAGRIICRIYDSGNLCARDKSSENKIQISQNLKNTSDIVKYDDPQTLADIRSQQHIVGALSRRFPGICLIAEEGELDQNFEEENGLRFEKEIEFQESLNVDKMDFPEKYFHLNKKDVTVQIDPLDGTKEYTEGIVECVTVLIGIAYKGEAIAGVIGQPFVKSKTNPQTCKMVQGCKGVGAFGYNDSVNSNTQVASQSTRRIISTRSHFSDYIQTYLDKCRPTEVLRYGGCGGKTLMLLEGKVDAYVFPRNGTKGQDTCAPQAILESAGGKQTLPNGSPLVYDNNQPNNVDGFVASYKTDHDSYLFD